MAENKQADNDELDYNPELDSTVKRLSGKHIHVITMKDINQLRINRDINLTCFLRNLYAGQEASYNST